MNLIYSVNIGPLFTMSEIGKPYDLSARYLHPFAIKQDLLKCEVKIGKNKKKRLFIH